MNFNDNIGLVYLVVNKKYNKARDKEDLIQEGMLGLHNAVDNFDVNYGVNFSTFAIKCIENQIKTYLRKESKNKIISFSALDPLQLETLAGDMNLSKLEVDIMLKALNGGQKRIVKELLKGKTVNMVAKMLHTSRQNIYKKLNEIKGVFNEEQNNYNTICGNDRA